MQVDLVRDILIDLHTGIALYLALGKPPIPTFVWPDEADPQQKDDHDFRSSGTHTDDDPGPVEGRFRRQK